MCGRYTLTVTIEELMARYLIDGPVPSIHLPRYNIAPGQMVPAIISDGKRNRLGELKWGLIPNWAKDAKIAYKTINAKAETLMEKPSFRTSFQRKRCLIPADSFYEWKTTAEGKYPMRIMMSDHRIFSMAGLYDTWISPDGTKISTCTIITTTPNRLMEKIHHRMPVILRKEDEAVWLDRTKSAEELKTLLTPYRDDDLFAYPVSNIVNSAKLDTKECIQPATTDTSRSDA